MRYCYIECVYTFEDGEVYEVVMCDKYFSKFTVNRLKIEQVRKLYEKLNGTVIFNFSFDKSYLKLCCNELVEVKGNNIIRESIGKEIVLEDTGDNFYNFIRIAIDSGYVFVEEEALDNDTITQHNTSPFSRLKFSKSTMTTYFILYGDTVRNKIITYLTDDGEILMRDFYFIAKQDVVFSGVSFVKKVMYRSDEYNLYKASGIELSTDYAFAFNTTLNKCDCCISKYYFTMRVFEDCLGYLVENDSSKKEWTGGTRDHRKTFGCYITNDFYKYTRKDRLRLIENALACCKNLKEGKVVKDQIKSLANNYVEYSIISMLVNIYSSGDKYKVLSNLNNNIAILSKDITLLDLYMYRVRTQLYLKNEVRSCTVKGSDEPFSTYISGGQYDSRKN